MIKIYLTNLGKYNEGELVGQWVNRPLEPEERADVVQEIGVDGREYEEYFIADYETDISMEIVEYSSLTYLNEVAEAMLEIEDANGVSIVNGIIQITGTDVLDAIDSFHRNRYSVLFNISNYEELGCSIAEIGDWEIPEKLISYIDFEGIGKDSDYTICDGNIALYVLKIKRRK